ncbi:MAG: hypothetical protein QNJ67_20310 [Kiloniellales bacterium]|nr:hypothetical protein [Kiloniellales bacterium]
MQKRPRPIRHLLTVIGFGAALLLWGAGLGVGLLLPDSSEAPVMLPSEIALGILVSMVVLGGGGYLMGWVSDRIDGLIR